MATSGLTLMAVHAHPDDESSSTGGVLARYASEGVRTVVVTCTDGAQGDGPGGVKPGDADHDEDSVVACRRRELDEACALLGVGDLEALGYRDSGMPGWEANGRPDAFANVPMEQAVGRVAELIERYRPQVLVTYDEDPSGYEHPDHVKAHRVAVAAADATGIPARVFYTAIPRSAVKAFASAVRASGVDLEEMGFPAIDGEEPSFGTADERIAAVIDVSSVVDKKRAALAAHASQTDNSFFLRLPEEFFRMAFSFESFVLRHGPVPVGEVSDDLFAGLR
ncbi:MAG TPA: PIG-L family deacetylase [Acidimicrobiales bacterium]|nr:PIG-L family deacetylase [Acidimicrobiales bacterium]